MTKTSGRRGSVRLPPVQGGSFSQPLPPVVRAVLSQRLFVEKVSLPSALLNQYYVREGRLERAGRGILRLAHFPPGDTEDLVPIWLWSGGVGVFSHETALALHDLSDALPAVRSLTVPFTWSRRRIRPSRGVRLHFADLAPNETAWKGPVPMTTPLRTVVDCARAHALPDIVRQAVAQGLRRGLFSRTELKAALKAAGIPISAVAA
jgi:hypothetical protein